MKKKVVFIINVDWYLMLHWLDRIEAIRDDGYEVILITRFTDKENIQRLESAGFKCHELELIRKSVNPILEAKNFLRIYSLIEELSPDIVHAVTVKPIAYAGLVCKLLRIPFIGSITGLGRVFSGTGVSIGVLRIVVKYLYRRVFKNRHSLALFENFEDQTVFINNKIVTSESSQVIAGAGVDPEKFLFCEQYPQGTPVVLFAARMIAEKGIYDFIDAIENLKAQGIPVRAKVAGILDLDALNRVQESKLKEWHSRGVVEWLGQCDNMPELLRSSNVVVLPTKYGEGIPRVLIEAAAVGRPIVATDVAGCREIVKDEYNGFLVPVGDVKQISSAIQKIILSKEKQCQFGKNGRELVLKTFTKEKIIDQTMNAYSLMKQNPESV